MRYVWTNDSKKMNNKTLNSAEMFDCYKKIKIQRKISVKNTLSKSFKLLLGLWFMYLCCKSIYLYSKWPIYTETNIVQQNDARFPALTICPIGFGYKEDVLKV